MRAFVKRIAPCDPRLSVRGVLYRPVVEADNTAESRAIMSMISSLEAQQSLREEIRDRYEDYQSSASY